MYSVSRKVSRNIFQDGLDAYSDRSHPCHHMLSWQERKGYIPVQMPEPFSGRYAGLGVVFIGLNPGITQDEIIPTFGDEWNFSRYDIHFRGRFDDINRQEGRIVVHRANGGIKASRLWNNIESFFNRYLRSRLRLEENIRLGQHALLIQTIRFKSKEGWFGSTAEEKTRVLMHERITTRKLITDIGAPILVPMGGLATRELGELLSFESPLPLKLSKAIGNTYRARLNGKKIFKVIPVKHFSYPMSQEMAQAVADGLAEAIAEI